MPCPLFEPRTVVSFSRPYPTRLPLIDEFDGICHAGELSPDPEHRFKYCNQGNARGRCLNFPFDVSITAVRFTVTQRTALMLTLTMVEEENFWPKSWTTIEFVIGEKRLNPEIGEVCRRAQAVQFCLSYLDHTK